MICESGKVVAIDQQRIWVETFQTSSCTACSAKVGCGTKVLNSLFSGKRHYVEVGHNDQLPAVKLYDEVEIAIPENIMLSSSFWVYLLPLVFMLAGAFLGNSFHSSDLGSISGAALGLIAAGIVIKTHAVFYRHDPRFQPVIHRVLRSNHAISEAIISKA